MINRMSISAFNQMDSGTFHEKKKKQKNNWNITTTKKWEAWFLRWHYYKGRSKQDRQWGKSDSNTDLIFVICRRTNSSISHTPTHTPTTTTTTKMDLDLERGKK